MTLFRRTRPAPPPAEAMPPRPPECRPPAPELPWASAWRTDGGLDARYDPCGADPLAAAPGKSGDTR
jgi:hypothetical protein